MTFGGGGQYMKEALDISTYFSTYHAGGSLSMMYYIDNVRKHGEG